MAAKKFKKINWNKCDKSFKMMLHGVCFKYCTNRNCSETNEECMAYKNWDKSDGTF